MSQLAANSNGHDGLHGAPAHGHGPDHAHHGHGHHAHGHTHGLDPAIFTMENTTMPAGWGKGWMLLLGLLAVLCLGATAAYPFLAPEAGREFAIRHALTSYHVGFLSALSIMLGALAFTLIMNLTKAGWSVTVRRQAENIAALIPLGALMALPVMLGASYLFKWFDPVLAESDHVLHAKVGYLNPTFFYCRVAFYFIIWCYLALRLYGYSRTQDRTGDRWLSNKAGLTSAWGILAFSLTTAFAGIDLIMTIDYHWFSTMFGVYFFAGSILAAVAVLILVMSMIRGTGRLRGLFTAEHSHDMGKLLFAFMVFWAYIGFSQYFLYWYANIPEETGWWLIRGGGYLKNAWTPVFWTLIIGHFLAPFPFLLSRGLKQSRILLSLVAGWLLLMQVVDFFMLVRPALYPDTYKQGTLDVQLASSTIGFDWVDATGILGPLLLLAAAIVWRIGAVPLIPINDPRLLEAAHHKNYM